MPSNEKDPFPWHLGIFDAHCHPTDTMFSISSISTMKTRCLTVMATRSQDQELVDQVAEKHGVKSHHPDVWKELEKKDEIGDLRNEECVIPCFGWHPWFSYQMYIDEGCEDAVAGKEVNEKEGKVLQGEEKRRHYESVLRAQRKDVSEEEQLKIFSSLPDPLPFSTFLAQTRRYLTKHPYALVGEVGLDRSFRIPETWVPGSEEHEARDQGLTIGGREGRRLTPYRVDIAHQKKILQLQLQLAAKMGRSVSVHGVQAHGVVFEALREMWKGHEKKVPSKREKKKTRGAEAVNGVDVGSNGNVSGNGDSLSDQPAPNPSEEENPPYPPRICLHSYSGNPDAFKQYLHPSIPVSIFASFSTAINLGDALEEETPQVFADMIKAVPDYMLLVESDLHTAGERMDERLKDIVKRICEVKGWGIEEGVRRLGENWRRFVFGEDEGSSA